MCVSNPMWWHLDYAAALARCELPEKAHEKSARRWPPSPSLTGLLTTTVRSTVPGRAAEGLACSWGSASCCMHWHADTHACTCPAHLRGTPRSPAVHQPQTQCVPGGIGGRSAHGHAAATGRVDDDACDTSVAESSERVPAQQVKQLERSCR